MTNSIEEALKKAVTEVESGKIVETETELTPRIKKILARKKNLQRKKRQHLPKTLR